MPSKNQASRCVGICVASLLEAAREMLSLDIWTVPIKPHTKRPAISNWQDSSLTLDDLREHFSNDPAWQGVLGLNEFGLHTPIRKSTPWGKAAGENWSDVDDIRNAEWLPSIRNTIGTK